MSRSDEELHIRAAAVMEHFIAGGFGGDTDAQRQRVFLNDTACIPVEIFVQAMRLSRQSYDGNGAPPASYVIKTAVNLEQRRNPERFLSQNGGMSRPRWYLRMQSGKPPEFALLAAPKPHKEIA